MKLMVISIALITLFNDPLKISKINSAKSAAKTAFNSGDYKAAIEKYKFLIDSLGVKEEEVLLNLAHAYYLQKDTANAATTYQPLTASVKKEISSKAFQQLGLLANQKGKSEEALNDFKQAVKADTKNEDARYNYEMLKKKLDKKSKEEQQKKDQNQKDQDKKQEPSEFAKRLKAQADKMIAQKQYKSAYDLMMNGIKQDQTVSSFQDYIDRIKDVAEINGQ